MYSHAVLAAALFLQVLPASAAVHEKLAAVPQGWSAGALADHAAPISLTIGLAQQNLDQLESKLMAVSTPGNAAYGQHLDVNDVTAMFAPTAEANTAVQSWLTSAGVKNVHSDGHWVSFSTTVGTANSLLNTTFANYQNNGVSKLRTTQYSVPDQLADHIDLISPTTYFGKTVANSRSMPREAETKTTISAVSKVVIDASCQTVITPTCLKQLYNTVGYTPDPKSGSHIGFGSFLNESAVYSDLFQYEKFFNIPMQNITTILINGATNDQNLATAQDGEADLDVENIIGVSHPLPVTEFITGGSPPYIPNLDEPAGMDTNEPYLPYYQYLLSQPNSALPQVISNSYGDDEDTVPYSYAVRVCNMIGMLGLRGITVLESSGDTGVGAGCRAPDGTPQFTPTFPATCPYITAVGGTQAVTPEVAWVDSSGGFSKYFPRAFYQVLAVDNYLANHISPATKQYYSKYTNFAGRGFPDISAHSASP